MVLVALAAAVHVRAQAVDALLPICGELGLELREVGVIAEREYDGPDPDYRNWYTLTETGNAVA